MPPSASVVHPAAEEDLEALQELARYEQIRLEGFADNHAANAFYEACRWSAIGPTGAADPVKIEFVRQRASSTSVPLS